MVDDFIVSRQPQSNAEFVAGCLPNAPHEKFRWALCIRWAIARMGRVHPRFIRSEDRFNDLMQLPGWSERGDPFFDVVGLVMLIEHAVRMDLRDDERQR